MVIPNSNHFFSITKTRFVFIYFLLTINICFGQKTTGSFYMYKSDGSHTANTNEAAFLLHIFSLNDTTYLSRLYHFKGPMIRQKSYKDSNLTIPNGRFCWYSNDGYLDSTGLVSDGKKHGNWLYAINEDEMLSVDYENGKIVKVDTLYDKDAKKLSQDPAVALDDSSLIKAQFKNGIEDWLAYCRKNLRTPERLQKIVMHGTSTCKVSFLIDKQGYTKDIYLLQSCEWSGDVEVMRLITDSPQWKPAIQNGKPVIYRQKQLFNYRIISN